MNFPSLFAYSNDHSVIYRRATPKPVRIGTVKQRPDGLWIITVDVQSESYSGFGPCAYTTSDAALLALSYNSKY